jgi:hypothetical protein
VNEPDQFVRPDPDVVAQNVGGETVLVHLQSNKIFALNATGARFWELLNEGLPKHAIVDRMLSEFDVDEGTLRTEIDALVSALAREDLVTDRDAG